MNQPKTERLSLRSIHALRGFAAGAVVVAHSIEHGKFGNAVVLFLGRFGVEVFFVISGIVICLAAGRGTFSPASFLTRRFFRVVPLYWATTILVALTAIAAPTIFKSTSFDAAYFVKSLFFVPEIVPGRVTDWRPLFKLGWTLNYEIFFYVVVAAFFWCNSATRRNLLVAASMTALVIASAFIERRASVLSFYLNLNLIPFIAGVILAELIQTRSNFLPLLAKWRWPLLIAAVATTTYAVSFDFRRFRDLDGHAAMSLAAVFVGLAALSLEPVMRAKGGLLNWLGDVSYSLYLLHMFIVGAVWAVLGKFGLASGAAAPFAAVVLTGIASAAASSLSYRWFERPINDLGHRLGRQSRPPAPVPGPPPVAQGESGPA